MFMQMLPSDFGTQIVVWELLPCGGAVFTLQVILVGLFYGLLHQRAEPLVQHGRGLDHVLRQGPGGLYHSDPSLLGGAALPVRRQLPPKLDGGRGHHSETGGRRGTRVTVEGRHRGPPGPRRPRGVGVKQVLGVGHALPTLREVGLRAEARHRLSGVSLEAGGLRGFQSIRGQSGRLGAVPEAVHMQSVAQTGLRGQHPVQRGLLGVPAALLPSPRILTPPSDHRCVGRRHRRRRRRGEGGATGEERRRCRRFVQIV